MRPHLEATNTSNAEPTLTTIRAEGADTHKLKAQTRSRRHAWSVPPLATATRGVCIARVVHLHHWADTGLLRSDNAWVASIGAGMIIHAVSKSGGAGRGREARRHTKSDPMPPTAHRRRCIGDTV